jgi:Fe-S-cluster-containing hydrogenase component 2
MIIHYGYEDGSGKYYVSIDAEKCDGCSSCINKCPQKALVIDAVLIDLEDKPVAVVHEAHRKKLQYSCASCHQDKEIHCVQACEKGAIGATWQKK